jgi:hypothetical protein
VCGTGAGAGGHVKDTSSAVDKQAAVRADYWSMGMPFLLQWHWAFRQRRRMKPNETKRNRPGPVIIEFALRVFLYRRSMSMRKIFR